MARRVLGESHELTLKMRTNYATVIFESDGATLDDLRESVNTFEETVRTARRVLGGAHPTTTGMEILLREARAALAAKESSVESLRKAIGAMAPGDCSVESLRAAVEAMAPGDA